MPKCSTHLLKNREKIFLNNRNNHNPYAHLVVNLILKTRLVCNQCNITIGLSFTKLMEIMQEILQQLDQTGHMIKHKRIHKHDGLPWLNPNSINKIQQAGMMAFTKNSQSKIACPSNWASPQTYSQAILTLRCSRNELTILNQGKALP